MVSNPIIVVGFGNNGTRVACWYLQAFGVHIEHRNNMMDFPPAGKFAKKCLSRNIEGDLDMPKIHQDFKDMILPYIDGKVFEGLWGFKLAIGMAIPNILHELGARIVHVIRDPRDVINSRKMQWASVNAGEWGEKRSIDKLIPRSIEDLHERYNYIWAKANTICADYCEKNMPDDYLRVRLEDLVLKKDDSLNAVANFLKTRLIISRKKIEALDENRLRKRMGKGNQSVKYAEIAMKRFGYL